ncbi:MAG: hypothetical protein QXT67_06550 [Candidatus Bathyarchaeia archaeon]
MDVPYSAFKSDNFWAFSLDERSSEAFPFEVLSVSCEEAVPGTLIFEITIRARERILSICVFAHILAYVNITEFPHENIQHVSMKEVFSQVKRELLVPCLNMPQ